MNISNCVIFIHVLCVPFLELICFYHYDNQPHSRASQHQKFLDLLTSTFVFSITHLALFSCINSWTLKSAPVFSFPYPCNEFSCLGPCFKIHIISYSHSVEMKVLSFVLYFLCVLLISYVFLVKTSIYFKGDFNFYLFIEKYSS